MVADNELNHGWRTNERMGVYSNSYFQSLLGLTQDEKLLLTSNWLSWRYERQNRTSHAIGLLSIFVGESDQLHADKLRHHSEKFNHDMVNRYLAEEVIRPRLVWENAQAQVEPSQYGFLALTIQSWTRTTPTRLNRLQFSSLARP